MFIYRQSTGELISSVMEKVLISGYSGSGVYKNNPDAEQLHNKGPIPQGEWGILGPPVDTSSHGPYVIHLYPKPGTETYERSGFLIHGDSKVIPGDASKGCIILPLKVRQFIWNSNDRDLKVIP